MVLCSWTKFVSVLEPRVTSTTYVHVRDLAYIYFRIRHTFATASATLFRVIKLNYSFIYKNKVAHTKVQNLPRYRYRETNSHTLLVYNGTVLAYIVYNILK